jgi:signal transduction histidine kinase
MGLLRNSVEKMIALVEGVLQNSRMDDNSPPGWFDCNAALTFTITQLQSKIRSAGAAVTSDLLPSVFGNRGMLVQIFQRLISNSIRYRNPHVPLHIHVSATKDRGEWIFSVEDNGMGIEPQRLNGIFELFQRAGAPARGGVGPGLPICKRVIEMHGGRMWVDSEPSRGARFYFTIPESTAESSPRKGPRHASSDHVQVALGDSKLIC